jgi:N-6 DNA Methylase
MADPELLAHREWLGYVQPVGVVVSPPALVAAQAYVNRNISSVQQLLLDVVDETPNGPAIAHLPKFFTNVLRWDDGDLVDAPADLEFALPEYGEVLRASYAVREPEPADTDNSWMMLLKVLPKGDDFDTPTAADDRGWNASPEAKFERLLREAEVPIGLLLNATHIRLVYSPRGETSGYLTFPVSAMTEVAGRPVLAALEMLLCAERLFSLPKAQRLPAILVDSRRYQNDVSTRLAGQVLAGLYELLRGFQAADDHAHGDLLRDVLSENPDLVYEGLLTALLRLVFLLYTEDRDLMPVDDVYTLHYSVGGLFDRLRADAGRHPDTMNLRYGAWAQLLSLFRIVFDGVRFGGMHLPARHGHLFDPDRFPFLEGRPLDVQRSIGQRIDAPLVSDGVVWRVLQNLLVLDGERLSYRTLDVEQIGSVYETMMGLRLEIAEGHSLAIKPPKPHGAPITINVDELLATATTRRGQWVREKAEQTLTGRESAALTSASTVADVEAAIERKIDRRATPTVVPAGAMVLQPNEERRRSGSFYTPRSLTEPIVRTTLRPIFDRLGDNPTPEAILDLKVCDPAMGSGAFLVEACRQLGDKLIDAWHAHNCVPVVPPDSDELLHARRLVAHRCLYGVDRNPIAVDLAKLSLWLATLARDHAFTFLDHALRCGDSLVGLTRDQIVAFHWLPSREKDFITRSLLQRKVNEAERLREAIRDASDDADVITLGPLLRNADDTLDDLRLAGDLAIFAFFSGTNQRERQGQRDQLAQQVWAWQQGADPLALRERIDEMRIRRHILPFHWEIEFPEVFERHDPGFDVIVGNPPFQGGRNLSAIQGEMYSKWLISLHEQSSGSADLVAHFFRRSFELLRKAGAFGLIATNTIREGDTRASGLRWICTHGGEIFAARRRMKWPGQVSVIVSVVHVMKGAFRGQKFLDDVPAETITAYLFHWGGHEDPKRLAANTGRSFIGNYVLGMGFTFDDTDSKGVASPTSEMYRLLEKDPSNAEVIFPYVGGEEINASPTHACHRYVINFGERTEAESRRRWPELMAIVEARVKPERSQKDEDKYPRMVKEWWKFWNNRVDLQEAIKDMESVLVTSRVRAGLFARMSARIVFSEQVVVFPLVGFSASATLQSKVHDLWMRFFSGTALELVRYAPTDCFETFPFPENWASDTQLEAAGKAYYNYRAALMVRNNEGLTTTYNRFHDPTERNSEIEGLRELHSSMDRSVLNAYGWGDIPNDCQFLLDYEIEEEEWGSKRKPYRYRWPDDVRDEVLARLLALNADRAEAERLQIGDRATRGKPKKDVVASSQLLFEEA